MSGKPKQAALPVRALSPFYRAATMPAPLPEHESRKGSFLCAFELFPNQLWSYEEQRKLGTLTKQQLSMANKVMYITQMGAFTRQPGFVRVFRSMSTHASSIPHEVMQYSLQLLSMKWPDPMRCSAAEIQPGCLSLQVVYDNGKKPEDDDERTLIVLGGTLHEPK